jgi:hypothetical protein
MARLAGGGIAVVREVLAGEGTWYLVRFGADPTWVEVGSGGPNDESSSPATDPIFRAGPYAAILLPTGFGPFEVIWEVGGGGRYRCDLGGALTTPGPCR